MKGQFPSLIPGQRLANRCWDFEEALDKRFTHLRGLVAVRQMDEDHGSAETFDQGPYRRVHVPADDQVTFPVTRGSAFWFADLYVVTGR